MTTGDDSTLPGHGDPDPVPGIDPDDEVLYCYRHSRTETGLRCLNCDRPICVDCAVAAAVGFKCKDCGRLPRAALGQVPTARLVRGAVVGSVVGLCAGYAYQAVRFGFFSLIIAGLAGMAIAEAVRWGTGGFRDRSVARIAVACAALGLGWPLVLEIVMHGGRVLTGPGGVFMVLAVIVAAVVARNRAI